MKNAKRLNHKYVRNTTVALIFALSSSMSVASFAGECMADSSTEKYYYSDAVNTGHDNGFSKSNRISSSDPHYGWDLGEFCVEGFTGKTEDREGNPVFLKNVGDTVKVSFELFEDIDRLNDDKDLSISKDTNGYDSYFMTDKTNCGRGMLIVRKTDYQNEKSDPIIYTDYLSGVTIGAETEIDLFEEGDYELSLNYEIKEKRRIIGIIPWFAEYHDYRIFFRFSVRNGNCMAYPIELNTHHELQDHSVTEEGFCLDFVNSRYLDICIQYESVKFDETGLLTDVRYNRKAREGEEYTEEGIYTITVKNLYTSQSTVKEVRVGAIWNSLFESVQEKSAETVTRYSSEYMVAHSENKLEVYPVVQYGILICLILISICLALILFRMTKKTNKTHVS